MRDESQRWQQILATGFSTVAELLNFLEIPVEEGSLDAAELFATRVPRGFAARMQKGNRFDPLLLQVLPQHKELKHPPGFTLDPLHENKSNRLTGMIHKYHGRVLLTLTGVCAVHCRYCFRRHFPYQENNPGRQGWLEVIKYIEQDSTINEVILSGGDPLLATDSTLAFLLDQLTAIPHLHTLRIHTRVPVVLPERIHPALCQLLSNTRLQVVVVLHANHPHELSEEVKACCELLRAHGYHLLNQSVLLAGVNNQLDTLMQLSTRLLACGVLPYYLHVLDKVQGAAHYEVDEQDAKDLHQALCAHLPGYLVPRLVREVPGAPNKVFV